MRSQRSQCLEILGAVIARKVKAQRPRWNRLVYFDNAVCSDDEGVRTRRSTGSRQAAIKVTKFANLTQIDNGTEKGGQGFQHTKLVALDTSRFDKTSERDLLATDGAPFK